MQKVLWVILAALLLVAFIWSISQILFPFLMGLILAYLLDPLVDWLEHMRLPRWLAAIAVTLMTIFIVVGVLLLLTPLLYNQSLSLAEKVPIFLQELRLIALDFMDQIKERLTGEQTAALKEKVNDLAGKGSFTWMAEIISSVWGGGLALINVVSLLIITPIILFYMLRDWDRIVASTNRLLPPNQADTIRDLVKKIDRVLSGFIRGQLMVCIMLGLLYSLGLVLIGLDFGLVIGLTTGFLSFIPYVGMLIGFSLSVLVAIAQFEAWQPIIYILVIFGLGQILEGSIITPKFVGDKVGLHPTWMIFALMVGGSLFGFLGILMAVPAAATFAVIVRFVLASWQKNESSAGNAP